MHITQSRTRFVIAPFAAAALGVAVAAPWAFADSPNFHYATTSVSGTGSLTVSFKETGLGNTTSQETITVHVNNASAEYQCWNKGGHHPQAGNKETVSTSIDASGVFSVRNGQTTGKLVVAPPGPGSFSCPGGQQLYLMSVTYSGITVTGQTGNVINATPDPATTGAIKVKV